MLLRLKTEPRNTLNHDCVQFLMRCFGTKPSHVLSNDVSRKKRCPRGGESGKSEEEEGVRRLRLFKSRGQHLLTNQRVLDSIVRVSDINSNDTVLEIGPGTGNLTLKLLEAAKKVVAIEVDKRMVEILRKRVVDRGLEDRLNILSCDALKTEFPSFDLVVANIPYNISSPLIAKLVFGVQTNPFRSATLLLQKEFARRLLAEPGDSEFNRLAANVKLVAEVELISDVSKRDFVPPPKVDSSVVKIYPKGKIPNVDLEEWWAFTRTLFGNKNKTLGAIFRQKRKLMELMMLSKADESCMCSNNMKGCDDEDEIREFDEGNLNSDLATGIDISLFREKIISILESASFLNKRPSKMSNDDLLNLLSLLNQGGVSFHDRAKSKNICGVGYVDCDDLL